MIDPIVFVDDQTDSLPVLCRILLWGIISGCLSMLFYAKLSPQRTIVDIQQRQKTSRAALLHYDGNWDGLRTTISTDLALALKQVRLIFLPFLLAVAPVVVLMFDLSLFYDDTDIVSFGPEWLRTFECWYLLSLTVTSVIIKRLFKIA